MFDRSPECCAKNIWDWSSGNLQCSVTGPQELVCTDVAPTFTTKCHQSRAKTTSTKHTKSLNHNVTNESRTQIVIKLDPGGIVHVAFIWRLPSMYQVMMCQWWPTHTAVMDVSEIIGLYNVKTILTDNSVQKLRNQKLNKTKCDFLDQIRLVRSSPDVM